MSTRHFFLIFAFILATLILAGLYANSTEAVAPPDAITQLTSDRAINVRPAWSPDNRFIAYQSNRAGDSYHIYVMDADGKNARAVTKGSADNRHPHWMPDGKAILFDSFDGTSREIWSVNVADGSLRQITRLGGLANFPSASPDSQRIAFFFYQDYELNLWTMKLDGTDAKPLTRALASAKNNQCTFACHIAAWSPDSQLLAYSGGEHETVWTMRSDGSDAKRVMTDEEHNHFPWFLADGRLGYITEHVQPGAKAWTDAWVYDLKTGEKGLLHDQMAMQGPFGWSNDLSRVLFHSPRSGNFNIFLIDLNAPGGLDALQGRATSPAAVSPSSSTTPASSASKDQDTYSLVAITALGVAGLAALFGVLYLRQKRRK